MTIAAPSSHQHRPWFPTRAVLMLAASSLILTGCASAPESEEDDTTQPSETPAPTYESLEGSRWEGILDENRIRLELEPDGTVYILDYNGLGPFDSDQDVWEQEEDTLVITLSDLFVDGDEQTMLDVTVSGSIDNERLTLEGEYTSGAPAVLELVPSEVS